MRQEDAFRAADDNRDGTLSPAEFGKHRAMVVAGILDKAPPQTPPASKLVAAIEPPGDTSVAPTGSWRIASLIIGNLLLLAGAAWRTRGRA
jgi:hypothetical protein